MLDSAYLLGTGESEDIMLGTGGPLANRNVSRLSTLHTPWQQAKIKLKPGISLHAKLYPSSNPVSLTRLEGSVHLFCIRCPYKPLQPAETGHKYPPQR